MSPFRLNIIFYIFNLTFDVLLAIEQEFTRIRGCSMSHQIEASEVVIEEMKVRSLPQCFIECSKAPQCGAVMFDRSIKICYFVDKDYKVCDENLGVYEMVSSIFIDAI